MINIHKAEIIEVKSINLSGVVNKIAHSLAKRAPSAAKYYF